MKINSYIFIYLPRFGLGNKLILWAKGNYLAETLNMQCYVFGWTHFSIGPIIRNEKSYRFYFGYFRINIRSWIQFLHSIFTKSQSVAWNGTNIQVQKKQIKIESIAYITDLAQLCESQEKIVKMFYQLISPKTLKKIKDINPPVIGMHIRRGDFTKSSTIVPIDYYINIINAVREITQRCVPVTIFSDGSIEELSEILRFKNVQLSKEKSDLLDLIMLSKSAMIVTAIGSSFSYWAAFISNAIVIHHPECWVQNTRSTFINNIKYEGIFDPANKLLISNLKNDDKLNITPIMQN